MTFERFVELPHLLIMRDAAGAVDAALAERDLTRRIAMRVPNFALVPHLLGGTDMLAVVGERIGRDFLKDEELETHDLPLAVQSWTISAVWRRQNYPDAGNLLACRNAEASGCITHGMTDRNRRPTLRHRIRTYAPVIGCKNSIYFHSEFALCGTG